MLIIVLLGREYVSQSRDNFPISPSVLKINFGVFRILGIENTLKLVPDKRNLSCVTTVFWSELKKVLFVFSFVLSLDILLLWHYYVR